MSIATQNRYTATFSTLKAQGHTAFMPFALLGWPTVPQCQQLIDSLLASQPAALELGFPFSDPIADGPLLQQAAGEALANGFTTAHAWELVTHARTQAPHLPITLMAYYNLLLAQGIDVFCAQAAEEGADGILVPDLPVELAHELAPHLQRHGLQQVMMVTPLTDEARLQAMLPFAGGFWYVVSRLGVTGVEQRYDEQLANTLQRLKRLSDLPACVGFGISTPQHVQAMGAMGADGAITASAIIQHLRQAGLDEASFTTQQAWVRQYVAEMMTHGKPS